MKRIVNSCDRCASAAVSVRRPYALQWMTYSCRRKWQRAVNRGHVVVGGRKPFFILHARSITTNKHLDVSGGRRTRHIRTESS